MIPDGGIKRGKSGIVAHNGVDEALGPRYKINLMISLCLQLSYFTCGHQRAVYSIDFDTPLDTMR